ncbi:formylglycine-generating enzyme family protein [Microseira wollei]|uniref:Serine/threonine protein kinase n=1 Tax=Microseira wollei NIES-4236 TaxID=2530354 RepID=A0AAV3XFL3_9CYAN|nr:formylglycine-generating enzyme family protein [Microseira wollei]GET39491.1 serine/threonine protein kinase [Microseira wollei NIES-4236]
MENENQPREYDAVLGGKSEIPLYAAVLGGILGVKTRLASPIVEVRIAALKDALKYGEAGLDLMIEAWRDESMQVKLAAFSLLRDRNEEKVKQNLDKFLPSFNFDVITVNAKGEEISRRPHSAKFFPEDLGDGVVLEIVYIPGGTFQMGSTERDSEQPVHQVTVKPFFIGKYPITQEQWQAVMGNNYSIFKGAKRPVKKVSWQDAVEFCAKLSQKTGKNYRLPSEAEWEYACRAGTTTPFHFGETITPNLVNYNGYYPYGSAPKGLYRKETTPVGSFLPNAFGLYDMHGNVCEWCSDRWHDNYNGAPCDGSSWETGESDYRVRRGGSWDYSAVLCRSAYRSWNVLGYGSRNCSFRVAVSLFPGA